MKCKRYIGIYLDFQLYKVCTVQYCTILYNNYVLIKHSNKGVDRYVCNILYCTIQILLLTFFSSLFLLLPFASLGDKKKGRQTDKRLSPNLDIPDM